MRIFTGINTRNMIFKRGNETILDFEVNSGTYNKTDTNVEYLDINLYLSHKVDWKKNDTTTYNGKTYYLDETSINEVMDSSVKWSYNLKFYPYYYSALDAMLTLDGRSSFSIDSTLSNLVDLVLASLNRVGSGWTKGIIENTIYTSGSDYTDALGSSHGWEILNSMVFRLDNLSINVESENGFYKGDNLLITTNTNFKQVDGINDIALSNKRCRISNNKLTISNSIKWLGGLKNRSKKLLIYMFSNKKR